MRRPLAFAALALLATACTDVGSASLLTSGMSAVISGEADGSGRTEVVVVLRAGGMASNTFVELEGDDVLTATAGAETTDLDKRSLGALHSYVGNLAVDAEDTGLTVALTRSVDTGAPASTVTLPAPFELGEAEDRVSPGNDLAFDWAPSGSSDEMEVVASGECIVEWSTELTGDSGAAVIPGQEITFVGDEPGTSCPIEITLRRVRGGQLDAGYGEGGIMQAAQIRTFTATASRSD